MAKTERWRCFEEYGTELFQTLCANYPVCALQKRITSDDFWPLPKVTRLAKYETGQIAYLKNNLLDEDETLYGYNPR